jgi:hypothetical protein
MVKNPGNTNGDTLMRSGAILVLIVSLLLAGRNTSASNVKTPKIPIHNSQNHHLQTGNA